MLGVRQWRHVALRHGAFCVSRQHKLCRWWLDYEQSLFFLGPSSKTPVTRKWPRAWLKARDGKFLLGLPPSFLASRVFAASRTRACAIPLLNLKKKRLLAVYWWPAMFTIGESQAISHSNDTGQQAQPVAGNPRFSTETPLERRRRRQLKEAARKALRTLLSTAKATSST